jgi:acetylornithine deacetylase
MQLPSFLEVYKGLITTDSISSTDPSWDHGNEKVIEKMAQWFKDVGFSVEVVEVEPGKHNMVAKMGSGEGGLLLAGHSDTVPFDEGRWNFDPHALTEHNNRFYGLGTADMKGFFCLRV